MYRNTISIHLHHVTRPATIMDSVDVHTIMDSVDVHVDVYICDEHFFRNVVDWICDVQCRVRNDVSQPIWRIISGFPKIVKIYRQ
jgi:hypothetical protein